MITAHFTTMRKGFDHSSIVLQHGNHMAMHPTSKEECARILKESMEWGHWNDNKRGRLEVTIVDLNEESVSFETKVVPI